MTRTWDVANQAYPRRKRLTTNRRGTKHGKFPGWSRGLTIIFNAFVGLAVFQFVVLFFLNNLSDALHFQKSADTSFSDVTRERGNELIQRLRKEQASKKNSLSRQSSVNITSQTPLDNYLSRQHISVDNEQDATELPILIIGGSDGSGTRAFVDMLGRLGVPMLVDDTGTLDVHAKCIFDKAGWPALVRIVLDEMKSANYSWDDLSAIHRAMLASQMKGFEKFYNQRGLALRAHGASEGFPVSSKVSYGFKAPVSMLVLPVLTHVYKKVKFLHVIRDGRDVSLSSNKSPIQKFYRVFYPDAEERQKQFEAIEGDVVFQEAMSMQLWNDWNSQVLDWETKHSDGETFDFLVMRTEDLMDPRTRFTSLLQLADFVGSQKNESEICCISKQKIQDMGKSGARQHKKLFADQSLWQWIHSVMPEFLISIFRGIYYTFCDIAEILGMGERIHMASSETMHRHENIDSLMDDGNNISPENMLEVEHRMIDSGVRERQSVLYEKLQARRRQRKESKRRKELGLDGGRRLFGEDAQRVPWGNQQTDERNDRPKVVVDHLKWDTMIERIKEVEEQSNRDHFLRTHDISEEDMKFLKPPSAQILEESPEKVMARYGKWAKAVQDRPELYRVLHNEGFLALRLFGYEPKSMFSDFPRKETTEQCPIQCNAAFKSQE